MVCVSVFTVTFSLIHISHIYRKSLAVEYLNRGFRKKGSCSLVGISQHVIY